MSACVNGHLNFFNRSTKNDDQEDRRVPTKKTKTITNTLYFELVHFGGELGVEVGLEARLLPLEVLPVGLRRGHVDGR